MSGERSGGEPTEKPTAKRLRDARRRGEVAQSRDLTGVGVLLAAAAACLVTAPSWAAALGAFCRDCLAGAAAWPESASRAVLGRAADLLLLASGPALGAAVVAALLVGLFQVRPLWTWEPLRPKLARLEPIGGLKRLFGIRRLVDLARSLVALAALMAVVAVTLKEALPDLLGLTASGPAAVTSTLGHWVVVLIGRGGLVLIVAAALDYGLQRYRHERDLRMTKEEVRREQKESEGDPGHRAARRRLHQEILEHDMVERVRTADLVVVNPTHIAVALRYEAARDPAPRVVAKGEHLLAARIKEVARQARVPIFHDVPLARALHTLSPGEEIPEALYVAVADLLRAVAEES